MDNKYDIVFEFTADIKSMGYGEEENMARKFERECLLAEFKYEAEKRLLSLRQEFRSKLSKLNNIS